MEVMEDKSLFVYDYVNLKNRELVKRHGKKRSLGDVDGKYRYHAPQQTPRLMGSLISLDFPETRAINTKSADNIISDQRNAIRNTYQKTFRASTLEKWGRPESSLSERASSSMENRPQTAMSESVLDLQPDVNNRGVTARPHTTGSRNVRTPRNHPHHQPPPPQHHPSGFMMVKVKQDGSVRNMGIHSVTDEIRRWWEIDDQKQRERARKQHSQNLKRYDSFAGQWLSFAGTTAESAGDGGVIEAFTGQVPKDEFYNIESHVGASVATQLKTGNKVRVGVNGKLQSDSLRVKKWNKEEEKEDGDDDDEQELDVKSDVKSETTTTHTDSLEDIFREARATAPGIAPFKKVSGGKIRQKAPEELIPLSWTEQVAKPNVKVIDPSEPRTPPPRLDLSERHPVVFHPLLRDGSRPQTSSRAGRYRINQTSRSKIGIDGAESLNNRITRVTVDQIHRSDGGPQEMTDEDYNNLLRARLKSIHMDEDDSDEDDDDDEEEVIEEMREEMVVVSPRRKLDDMQEVSTYSIGKESEMSGLTVEKPPTVRSPSSMTDIHVQGVLPSESPLLGSPSPQQILPPEKPYVRQVSSAIPGTRYAQSGDPLLRAPSRSMARSAGSRRVQPLDNTGQRLGARSAGSQRALSSASSRRKSPFDQKVTPRNAQSPRSGLARPGQLPRTKVSSISSGPQEGDQAYIQISQQLLKPGDGRAGMDSAISFVSDMNLIRRESMDAREPSISSLDDRETVDSMNVQRGDPRQQGHYHEDGTVCTCSPQAKRAMSAALSAMSHVSTEHSIINIPTARMTPTESERNSLSDMDPLSSTSTFRRTSFGEDEWKEAATDHSIDKDTFGDFSKDYSGISAGVAESGNHGDIPRETNPAEGQSASSSREIVINRHDGLDSLGITPPRSAGKKRTVKFSDEIEEPYVPFTSPISTPRDPGHPGSAEGSLASGEFVLPEERLDLSNPEHEPREGAASVELTELRAKIKADLKQSQVETKQDLKELKG